MRKTIPIVVVAVMLIAGLHVSLGEPPKISIIKSNENVIVSWPQTIDAWTLYGFTRFNECSVSNGVERCLIYQTSIIPNSEYSTNGSNIFVVLPVNFSTNQFYKLQPGISPPLPPLPQIAEDADRL